MSHPHPHRPWALRLDVTPASWAWHRLRSLLRPHALLSGAGPLRQRPHEEPTLPGPQWCRARTRLGGVCGSDVAAITLRGHPASVLRGYVSFPMTLGHENVALLQEVGPDVAHDDAGVPWRVGDRVLVEPTLACAARQISPPCPACAAGRPGVCERFSDPGPLGLPPGVSTGYNALTGGSWGPTFLAHRSQLVRAPADMTDERLILVDPLACALHGVCRRLPPPGGSALVWGAGVIGLGVVAALRALGFTGRVLCVARHAFQADRAKALGASDVALMPRAATQLQRLARVSAALGLPAGALRPAALGNASVVGGVDVAYDAVGSGQTTTDCLKLTQAGGAVVLLGTLGISLVDLTAVWFNEVTLLGSYGRGLDDADWPGLGRRRLSSYAGVLALMGQGLLNVDSLLTHLTPASQWRSALTAAAFPGRSQATKAALDWR